jgi:hypothetical protein
VSDYEKIVKASLFRNAFAEKTHKLKGCTKCSRKFPRGEGLPHTGKPKAEHDFTLCWVKGHYHERNKGTGSCVLCECRIRMDAWRKFAGIERDSDVEHNSGPKESVAAAGVDKGACAPKPTIPVSTRQTIDHTVSFFFLPQPADNRDADTKETEADSSDTGVEDGPGPKDDDVAAGNDEGTSTPSSTFATSIRQTPDHTAYFFFFFLPLTLVMQAPGKQAPIPLFVLAMMVLDLRARACRRGVMRARLPQAPLCHSDSPNN